MNKRRLNKAFKRISNLPKNKYLVFYIVNKFRNIFLKFIKSTKVTYPSSIMLELTNHCNLACTTCAREHDYGKEMDKGRMTVSQAKNIIDELWPYLDSVGLTGMGETFLYKEIEEVVDYIKMKNKGIIIFVSTNAMLPNFISMATPIIGKIDTLQVSIDGLGDVYELIRKKANFITFDKNLRHISEMCKDTDTDLMLNMVVTKENFFQMHLLVKYAEEIGVDFLDFTLFNLASVTNIERSYYDFYKSAEFLDALSLLEETLITTPKVQVTNKNFKTENGFKKCSFPWSHFYVCWNGFVAPCCAKPFPKELNFGNVFNNKVMDVFNSDKFKGFRKLWFANETPNFCQKCHLIDIEPINKSVPQETHENN